MRVLVTGAGGFLGRAVLAALRGRGHETAAFVRRPDASLAGEVISGDMLDRSAVTRAVTSTDAVCHLAAATRVRDSLTDPLDYWRTNVIGTLNVLDAVARSSTASRVVLASTAAVYGTPEHQPINEDASPAPTNPYGRTKLAADQAAADLAQCGQVGAVSLRAFNVAGAADGRPDHDLTRLIPRVLAVQAGLEPELTVNGDGSAIRDFVHVMDMAEAFALALETCAPGSWRAYNLGSGRQTSVEEVIRLASEVTGLPVKVRHLPPANEPPILLADSARIRSELGWQEKSSDPRQIIADAWKALTSRYAAGE